MNNPIIIDPNSMWGQLAALARYLLTAFGAFALGRGYIDNELLQLLTGLFTVALPTAYGIYKTWQSKQKLVEMADATTDDVAVVKR